MRPNLIDALIEALQFQSTHPVWDATRIMALWCDTVNFNPRIPYGMRRPTARAWSASSHFNPRIPYGMRRPRHARPRSHTKISIHVSRMGCDLNAFRDCSRHYNFNPRIPYGMRLIPAIRSSCFVTFQSTHPVWDATSCSTASARCGARFQSTHPVWDATRTLYDQYTDSVISIHASRMGCDRRRWRLARW